MGLRKPYKGAARALKGNVPLERRHRGFMRMGVREEDVNAADQGPAAEPHYVKFVFPMLARHRHLRIH